MGAADVVQIITGDTLRQAFDDAQQAAGLESGYSYSGTISQAAGIQVMGHPMLEWDAMEAAQALIDQKRVAKWGAAGAIPIVEPLDRRTVTTTVDVTGLDWDARRAAVVYAVRALARPGEGIFSLEERQDALRMKVVTTVPKAGTKRVFVIRHGGRQENVLYPSQAAARAAAEKWLEQGTWATKVEVVGLILREDDGPLLTVERKTTKSALKVTVTFGKRGTKPPTSWAVAGIYSS